MKRNDELSQKKPTQIVMDMDIELMQDVEIEEIMDEVKEEGLRKDLEVEDERINKVKERKSVDIREI